MLRREHYAHSVVGLGNPIVAEPARIVRVTQDGPIYALEVRYNKGPFTSLLHYDEGGFEDLKRDFGASDPAELVGRDVEALRSGKDSLGLRRVLV